MTPKEKYQDIDLSKLPEKAVEQLEKVKPFVFEAKYESEENKELKAKGEEALEKLYDLISQKYPESIKSKQAKAPEPTTPQAVAKQVAQKSVKQPSKGKSSASTKPTKRGEISRLAKEIRKEGERFQDAMKRAGEMIQAEKKKAVTNANKQYKKLEAFLKKNPAISQATVSRGKKPNITKYPLDVNRDAPRKALPAGRRVSKDGNTYYEYRENRTDKHRKRYPYLALGGKLHGAGMFNEGGMYAKGGVTKKKMTALWNEYQENQDENYHSENVVLLAKHFGTKEDLKEAKRILAEHDKQGSLTDKLRKERDELHHKLYPKLVKAAKEEGVVFAKGGRVGYKGQSILLHTVPSPKYNRFLDTEIVIEKIDNNKIVKSFVRETGEKVPFIIDDRFKKEQYAKGGGVGLFTPIYFKSKGGIQGFDKDEVFYVGEIPTYGNVKVHYYDGVLPRFIWFYKSKLEEGFESKDFYKVSKTEYREKQKMTKGGELNNLMPHSKTHRSNEK